eukprot:TRINITY_DN1793_c0_g2_i1.p1 TRINITY_DN1793_c0_g2~~TRINITY_DN1793_c0_g2_i1.p1  ORF type:complete len:109 (-),score=7.71 TRINITY_DN1793_c0_g2_i1:490-816(-)
MISMTISSSSIQAFSSTHSLSLVKARTLNVPVFFSPSNGTDNRTVPTSSNILYLHRNSKGCFSNQLRVFQYLTCLFLKTEGDDSRSNFFPNLFLTNLELSGCKYTKHT